MTLLLLDVDASRPLGGTEISLIDDVAASPSGESPWSEVGAWLAVGDEGCGDAGCGGQGSS
jgi:hypothetical protein